MLVLYVFSYAFLNVKSHPRMHQKNPPFSGKNSNFGARQFAPFYYKILDPPLCLLTEKFANICTPNEHVGGHSRR